jgi:hypothetical protein
MGNDLATVLGPRMVPVDVRRSTLDISHNSLLGECKHFAVWGAEGKISGADKHAFGEHSNNLLLRVVPIGVHHHRYRGVSLFLHFAVNELDDSLPVVGFVGVLDVGRHDTTHGGFAAMPGRDTTDVNHLIEVTDFV